MLAADDQDRAGCFGGITDRQDRTHIDIGAGWHRLADFQFRIGKGFGDTVFCCTRLVTGEYL